MTAILYRASAGVAGDVTRPDDTIVESAFISATNPPTTYGVPVKLVDGKIQAFTASDDESVLYGILTRVAPSESRYLVQSAPKPEAPQGVVVQGYVLVKCKNPNAAKRGAQVVLLSSGADINTFSGLDEGPSDKYLAKLTFASNGGADEELAEIRVGI